MCNACVAYNILVCILGFPSNIIVERLLNAYIPLVC